MSLAIDPLRKISPWKEAWSIEAKILTIWEDASIVNENMQKLLHVVLMDKHVSMCILKTMCVCVRARACAIKNSVFT